MTKLISERLYQAVVVLIGISFITFLLTYLAPGDPAEAMFEAIGINPTAQMLENTRQSLGLDKPFLERYFDWLTGCLRGDFGTSFSKKNEVIHLLKLKLPYTMNLAFTSTLMMVAISIPLGILSAVKKGRAVDLITRVLCFAGDSMPNFLTGLILLYIFSLKLGLVKIASIGGGTGQVILPATTLAIAMSSRYIRQVRVAILEELSKDYVIGALSRGLSKNRILFNHVLPNALLPLLTMLGLSVGSLLGGTSVVEIIFGYPGLGDLAVSAIKSRDYPLIQGFVLWMALIYMIVNMLVDISYAFIDPRIRQRDKK